MAWQAQVCFSDELMDMICFVVSFLIDDVSHFIFSDLDGVDWMGNPGIAAVTTVLATTVMTSAVMSPAAMSQDGEPRPASMPSVMSPHLLAASFGADPSMEPALDAHLQVSTPSLGLWCSLH